MAAVVRRARREVSIRQRFYSGDDGQPFPPGPSAVVLVSHGDALQLLHCALAGRPAEQHRSLPHLENCGVRVLRPPPPPAGEAAAAAEAGENAADGETGNGEGAEEEESGGGGVGAGVDTEGALGGGAGAFRATGARVFRTPATDGEGDEKSGKGGGEG